MPNIIYAPAKIKYFFFTPPLCIFHTIMTTPATDTSPGAAEPLSFDETVKTALAFCASLPPDFAHYGQLLAELQTRLSKGRLHFAILGQFNRGKSTFINALLRIKALPTSVLPLTSVPTLIEHGAPPQCRVRFLNGQDDLVVGPAADEIEQTLRQYVAEENNPKNKLGVKDATLSYPSQLLANGTVLIDTPGFGSTHLHNTQTTLDLLIECDAALFLLSADPPMTQTEMDFLRQVKERIPKLYFILNKVDLLSPQELNDVERFIRNILRDELGFPPDTTLYRTCAVKGERAANDKEGAKTWAKSGLAAVKKEVLDFMVREKYFTLSEALNDKYSAIIADIKTQLNKTLTDLTTPITAAQQEADAITNIIKAVTAELNTQTKHCADEKQALYARLNTITKEHLSHGAATLKKALHSTLDGKYFPAEAASIAAAMLPKHAADFGNKLLDALTDSANKTIRALALHHALTIENLQKKHAVLLKSSGLITQNTENFVEQAAIPKQNRANLFDTTPWQSPQPQLLDMFKKKIDRFKEINAFYEPLCESNAKACVDKAVKHAMPLCNSAVEKLQAAINASYQDIIDYLQQLHNAKADRLRQTQESTKEKTAFLAQKIRECGGLKSKD